MSEKSCELIPKRIFIVPYRNRAQQKFFFCKYMSFILEDKDDYEIFFSHQCDAKTFNRGAMKNIGFITARNKYPEHYKDITFIFNDVDTIPFHKIFDYETTHGIVKHYYGFKYTLGGIVVIKGSDFEKTNGFPCFWGWGMEDNVLQKRCEQTGLKTDRSVFYNIGSPEILQLFDGISRIISKKDSWRGEFDNGIDGLKTIYNFKAKSLDGIDFDFNSLKGKKVLIVNTASKCGYTSQYSELEALFQKYGKSGGLVILGFPCNQFGGQEPGNASEIQTFCTKNYGVTFQMMEKIDVKGNQQQPIYKWLTTKEENNKENSNVTWNFNKYLIDEKGQYICHLGSNDSPNCEKIINWLEGK